MKRRDFISLMGGAVVALPSRDRSQASLRIPTVAYLWHAASPKEESPYFEALHEGFTRLGYVEGRDINLLHRFPDERPERFKSMAAELVALEVNVLMGGAIASSYLRDATTKIPIVFMFVPDPVGVKLVRSLARPGGNATGLSNFGRDIAGKRLQLLKELVPGLARVALLTNPNQETTRVFIEAMGPAAEQLGLTLQTFDARSLGEMEPAFDAMARAGMQAVVAVQGGTAFQGRALIPKLALSRGIAMCAYSRETFEHGALVSYAPDHVEMCRRSAVFADKILKGAKPGDIPVEQPTALELLINLKTAKTLGIDVPLHLQQIADNVIE
jgi:putative tryptophan/tyrosine transport system substrate-binding protein